MDAYRSELDAAERRLALLNDAIAERERELHPSRESGPVHRPGRRLLGPSLAFFAAVTGAAAVSFARSPTPRLEATHVALRAAPDTATLPDEDRNLPLLTKLERKVDLGTATSEEREALQELTSLYERDWHLRRSFGAMTRLADGRPAATDLTELGTYCYLGGHRRCLAVVERASER